MEDVDISTLKSRHFWLIEKVYQNLNISKRLQVYSFGAKPILLGNTLAKLSDQELPVDLDSRISKT